MVNTDQDQDQALTLPPTILKGPVLPWWPRPRHVPPIVELHPPGQQHPVRGQMSQRPLTQVVTHQPSASDPNKHWNKLRDGGEKGERDDKIKHI